MTKKEETDFLKMYHTLRRIAYGYMTPRQIERDAGGALSSQEYLSMAYENIQQEAKDGLKGVRLPKKPEPVVAAVGS